MLRPNLVLTILISVYFVSVSDLWAGTRQIRNLKNAQGTIIFHDNGFVNENHFQAQPNWHQLDLENDFVFGISSERAYEEFPQIAMGKDIIVAVIDSGIDVNHEDLIGNIWINKGEIPNNNIDDDENGYIDDVMGWNFLGNPKGSVQFQKIYYSDETESHIILPGKTEYQLNTDMLSITHEYKYLSHIATNLRTHEQEKLLNEYFKIIQKKVQRAKTLFSEFQLDEKIFKESLLSLQALGVNAENLCLEILYSLDEAKENIQLARKALINYLEQGIDLAYLIEQKELYQKQFEVQYNINSDHREKIVGDNPEDLSERYYGNNNIMASKNVIHGTHVAGIIAANRLNHSGMKGVAKNVKIMPIRAIPDGDERDKDIINAIYYAVNNGADIINMSFGKYFSAHPKKVQAALQYARDNNVLIVQAAGNDYENIDLKRSYPDPFIEEKKLENYITVAATTPYFDESLISNFSNYGKETVDILAPGSYIYSTVPQGKYGAMSGTSMAAPMVSALAAIILSQNSNTIGAELTQKMKVSDLKNLIVSGMTNIHAHIIQKPNLYDVPVEQIIKWPGVINLRKTLQIMLDEYSNKNKF